MVPRAHLTSHHKLHRVKMRFESILLFVILYANYLTASAQPDRCSLPTEETQIFVPETFTGSLWAVEVGGNDVINGFSILDLNNAHYYVRITSLDRLLTFSPILNNFTNYLDIDRPITNVLYGEYRVNCPSSPTLTKNFTITFEDTNNRVPEFTINNPDFRLKLDTWQSSTAINFISPILVTDQDYELNNSAITLSVESSIISARNKGFKSSTNGRVFEFDLFLDPDASPGSYTSELRATDGVYSVARNITLYIA